MKRSLKNEVVLMSDSEESEEGEMSSDSKEDTMDIDSQKDDVDCEGGAINEDVPPVDVSVSPGHSRLKIPHPKAKAVLSRFAAKDDKKLPEAEKRSQCYQKYGNPNYGDDPVDKAISNRPIRSKQLRMRMYADDEEEKKKCRTVTIPNRSEEFGSKPHSVYSRLGPKCTKDDLFHPGSKINSSDEEDNEKIHVTRRVSSPVNIWADIAKSMDEEETHSRRKVFYKASSRSSQDLKSGQSEDLRSTLSSSSFKKKSMCSSHDTEDLRSKIKRMRKDATNTHRSPLFYDDEKD